MSQPSHNNDALLNADFSDAAQEKATSRRRDQEDVMAGRRTALEVQRANSSWVTSDLTSAKVTNAAEADEHL